MTETVTTAPTPPAVSNDLDLAIDTYWTATTQYRALAAMGNRDAQAYLADLALNAAILAGDGTLICEALWWSQLVACHNLRTDAFRLTRVLLLTAKYASQRGFELAADGHRADALSILVTMAQAGDDEAAQQAGIIAAESAQDSPMILAMMEPQGAA